MQHVLFLGKVWPEPGSSAAGSRTLQLVQLFREQAWKVSFACAAGESEYTTDLSDLHVQTYAVEINNAAFDELIKTLQPGIVIFDRFVTEEQFGWRVAQHCPQALRVLDTIDLHCLRIARHEAVKQNRPFETLDLLKSETARREIASIYRCDLSLMVSEVEMQLLDAVFKVPKALLHYIPLFFDPVSESQLSSWKPFDERVDFISIGNFLHEPNWDAVLYLKKNIWPLIRKKLPSAALRVYGAYASQKVLELHNVKEGFLINGRADNAYEVMSQARICLAPLRFGAGIKGKLLDAMNCGTPSITTGIGAESMHSGLSWNGAIADDPEKFAEAAVTLYTNQPEWERAQQQGAIILNTVFAKKAYDDRFLEIMLDILSRLEQHRLDNFTGGMLQHQNNAATKYMALWIEEKNKAKSSLKNNS